MTKEIIAKMKCIPVHIVRKKTKHLVSKYSRKIRNTTQKDHDDDN